MNNKFYWGVAAVVLILAVLLLSGILDGRDGRDGRDGFSAQVGNDHFDTQTFFGNFIVGGDANSRFATTSAEATITLSTLQLRKKNSYVTWTADLSTTLTTMASSAAPFVGMKVGEVWEQTWYSATTTAAATITFAGGTGVDLQELEGGTVIINGLEGATLKFVKKADTDILMLVAPWQVGD